jgi:hypothetical protein
MSDIPFCISVAATAFFTRSNLTIRVSQIIAIPRFPPKLASNTIKILNIGRLTISIQRSAKIFIKMNQKIKINNEKLFFEYMNYIISYNVKVMKNILNKV